ncbi:MAG: glycosyltransferase [Phycisphaerae bacterium]|nr:glycosyltransferase [Phycisphaerae bacterium]
MCRRSLLLVAYHFPPRGGSGVQRALKLATYLPRHGWDVHVLTAGHSHHAVNDESLIDDSAVPFCVHRILGWEPGGVAARIGRLISTAGARSSRVNLLEDRIYWRLESWGARLPLIEIESMWKAAAIRAGSRLIESQGIECVVTTSPPHSMHQIGATLSRRHNVPWIADLRDPIVDNFAIESESAKAARWRRRIESDVCMNADRVVVTCPDLGDRLVDRHGPSLRARLETVFNGFDAADAPDDSSPCDVPTRQDRFVLSYVGAFYRAQTIEPLLAAVRSFLLRRCDANGRFELRVVGTIAARLRSLIRDSDRTFVRELGYVPHKSAIRELLRADALFLMTPTNAGGRLCVPAKLFEYLAFGRHVIGLVHACTSVERILAESSETTIVRHGDADGLSRAIEARFDAWITGAERFVQAGCGATEIAKYRRDFLAGQFAGILTQAIRARSRDCGSSDPGAATEQYRTVLHAAGGVQ